MCVRYFVFAIFFVFCSVSFGQTNKYANTSVASEDSTFEVQRIKEHIEAGVRKYGKENLKQVLIDMLYDDIKKIVDAQGPNPMDVLYDKMIKDLSEEAQGKENHAVEYYSKAFADSLIRKLYYNYNLGKREQKYKDFALNLISAAFCKGFNSNNKQYKIMAYNDVILFRNYDIYNQQAIRDYFKKPLWNKYYSEYCNNLDSLNYSSNQDVFKRAEWELNVENFGRFYFETQAVPSFSDIRRHMPANSTLIEYSDTYISGKTYMCAYIIRNKSVAPDIVILNVADTLKTAIINGQDSKTINDLYEGSQLYQTFIAPLLPYIQGEILYIAPSSYLSFVNFSAIKNGIDRLSSKYKIVRLYSGTDLVNDSISTPIKDAALFGNIKYHMSSDELTHETARFVAMRSGERGNLSSLPNSLTEVKQINNIFKSSTTPRAKIKCYYDKNASEARFKSFDGNSPDLIHLATHGYYLNAKDRLAHTYFKENDFNSSTMLFNGLLLSGATLAWNNGIPTPGVEDGILTSEEISRLDLSKTKLVVMSACCTALGDYNEVEGVFGLQRAFKLAGVKAQISTLWPVQDDVAYGFMASYYQNYVKTKSIYAAYNYALEETQSIYPDPYHWAGFILLGY